MASGSPSRRRHISATAAALDSVSLKSGRVSRALAEEEGNRRYGREGSQVKGAALLRQGEGGDVDDPFAADA